MPIHQTSIATTDLLSILSPEQNSFINSLGIKSSQIFNATNMTRKQYSKVMKDNDFKVAFGVTPCKKGNHTLRNSSGNCLQCFPLSTTYEENYKRSGYIYIAHSTSSNLIKIGSTNNVEARAKSLNNKEYGNCTDWVIYSYIHSEINCGNLEKKLHSLINKHKVITHYINNKQPQATYELFNYPPQKAKKLLTELLHQENADITTIKINEKIPQRKSNRIKRSWTDKNREERLIIKHKYAEAWLDEACQLISENFARKGFITPKIRVLFGFSTSGHNIKKYKGNHKGQCLSRGWTSDGTNIILITPTQKRAIDALATLGHEIIHAIDNCENQHGKKFIEIAKSLDFGILGNETYLSDKLHEEFIEIEEKVGRFPAVALI